MKSLKKIGINDVEKINIYGRNGSKKEYIPLLFNGSGVEISVDGTECWIEVSVEWDYHEMWVAVELNGSLMARYMLHPGIQKLCLFRNMSPDAVKTVKFYRELQAMSDGAVDRLSVLGFELDGDFKDVPKHSYKIEFIGDSITSGEGTYGAKEDMDWLPMYMSFSKDYTYDVAKNLNADYRVISQGGWGVYCGWDKDLRHNIPNIYEKVCGFSTGERNEIDNCQEEYDFSWKPDAIVINLGTNDSSAVKEGIAIEEVENAVYSFLKMVRSHNPDSYIVWCYGMIGYDISLNIANSVKKYIDDTDDNKTTYIQLANTSNDKLGSRCHPGIPSHEAAAVLLTDYLKGIL